mmetsp:Transcript_40568/g.111651  ORF Transcript_40568/g.111651 Transcript_40568/m.111651 type:complete len:219 (-) Transcript_40568:760-1416(-)
MAKVKVRSQLHFPEFFQIAFQSCRIEFPSGLFHERLDLLNLPSVRRWQRVGRFLCVFFLFRSLHGRHSAPLHFGLLHEHLLLRHGLLSRQLLHHGLLLHKGLLMVHRLNDSHRRRPRRRRWNHRHCCHDWVHNWRNARRGRARRWRWYPCHGTSLDRSANRGCEPWLHRCWHTRRRSHRQLAKLGLLCWNPNGGAWYSKCWRADRDHGPAQLHWLLRG